MNDNSIYKGVPGWKTVWIVYAYSNDRQVGYSSLYETLDEATYWLKQWEYDWNVRLEEQTYELED